MAEAIKMGGGAIPKTDKIGYYSCKEGSIKAGTPVEFTLEATKIKEHESLAPYFTDMYYDYSSRKRGVQLDDGRLVCIYPTGNNVSGNDNVAMLLYLVDGSLPRQAAKITGVASSIYVENKTIYSRGNTIVGLAYTKLFVITINGNEMTYKEYTYPKVTLNTYTDVTIQPAAILPLSDNKILALCCTSVTSRNFCQHVCILELGESTLNVVANTIYYSSYSTDKRDSIALARTKNPLRFLSDTEISPNYRLSYVDINEDLTSITITDIVSTYVEKNLSHSNYNLDFGCIYNYVSLAKSNLMIISYDEEKDALQFGTASLDPHIIERWDNRYTYTSDYSDALLNILPIENNIYVTLNASSNKRDRAVFLYIKNNIAYPIDNGFAVVLSGNYTTGDYYSDSGMHLFWVTRQNNSLYVIDLNHIVGTTGYYYIYKIDIYVKKAESAIHGIAAKKITSEKKDKIYII